MNPIRAFFRTCLLLITRRLHFPRDRVGQVLVMADGQRFIIFRQAVVDPEAGQPENPEARLVVRFRVAGLSPRLNKAFSVLPIPFFTGLPGFRSKLWAIDPRTGFFQGDYGWQRAEDAARYAQSFAMRFMIRRAEPGSISSEIVPWDQAAVPERQLRFRLASQDDAGLIADFGAWTFRAAFGSENLPEDMDAYIADSFSKAKIAAELIAPASWFLLAYEGERLAGYSRLHASEIPEAVKGPRPVELVRIYVAPDLTGAGYGSALMARCLQEARRLGYGTVWLGVWERNPKAIQFYRKWGFEVVGKHDFVLGTDVQHDYLMACRLD